MRSAAIILGIVGGLAAAGAGAFLMDAARLNRNANFALALELIDHVPESVIRSQFLALSIFFVLALPPGFLAALAAYRDRGKVAGVLMLIALLGPVLLASSLSLTLIQQDSGVNKHHRRSDEDAAILLLVITALPAGLLGAGAYCAFAAKKELLRHPCPHCQTMVHVDDPLLLGKTVRCGQCGISVPLPETPPSEPQPTRLPALGVTLIAIVYLLGLVAVYSGVANDLLVGTGKK